MSKNIILAFLLGLLIVNESLAEKVVTEDLVEVGGKKYKTSEVGNYLAQKILL